ncbi:putative O-glycosylation ligase, exosortase A system-associated [Methylomonas sp. LL1]|uniref:putative O-glycosylation ligase, exosortase A system-associated n=1 Tax=Methylomonas sp. LL1 TaxID=2785785 RepID=UPI0018C3705E|nr:putative O-glycosylation ligase, exosortase A system-associated [Methylomonas sp. LL1]QPK65321.1 putative O-glycosylation ligase, exosortase A system-associated [Methylomonas sp. LL1]
MRDITVLLFLIFLIVISIRKAWLGVLALSIFGYMNPHSYAWGFVRSLPVYYTLFLVVCFSYLKTKDKQPIFFDWRVKSFLFLWFYFCITTVFAWVQFAAIPKLIEVTKIYIPFFFTLALINTKEKLYYLIITIACSIGIIAFKGGLFALATGFSYRVWGPSGTQYFGNNEFALMTIIAIPLLILFRNETQNNSIKLFLLVAIPVCVASAISSWSRGALLALIGSSTYLIWHSKRKFLLAPAVVGGVIFSLPYLPEKWFNRMQTIETYEEDKSALGRLEVWRDGWNYALDHPFVGAGFEGWRMVSMRDWHSAYVEIFSEHGFIAFGIWLSMILGSLLSLTRLQSMTRNYPELKWVNTYSISLKASLIAYMIGAAFLGVSYWDLLYHLIFIAALTKKFALEELDILLKNQFDSRNKHLRHLY